MNYKAVLCKCVVNKSGEPDVEISYKPEFVTITSVDDMLCYLGANSKLDTNSIHLKTFDETNTTGVSIYTSKSAIVRIGSMTAHVTDRNGAVHFWSGDFLVCGEAPNALRDIRTSDIYFAFDRIDSKYLSKDTVYEALDI